MGERAVVTYQKNGQKTTMGFFKFHFFYRQKVCRDRRFCINYGDYEIPEDVEWLHFKNFYFFDSTSFSCLNQDTLLFFENCYFKDQRLSFYQGSIVLEQPHFFKDCDVIFRHVDHVDLILSEERQEKKVSFNAISIENLLVQGNCSKFLFYLPNVKELTVKNAVEFTSDMTVFSSMKVSVSELILNGLLKGEKMKVEKGKITGGDVLDLSCVGLSTISDAQFEAKKIITSNATYSSKDGKNIVLTDADFKEESGKKTEEYRQLISCLHLVKENVESCYRGQRDTLVNQLKEEKEKALLRLEEERKHQEEKFSLGVSDIEQSLNRQKVKSLFPKG